MRPELTLKEAPSKGGPDPGAGGKTSYAFRGRLDQLAAFGAPVALILGLALTGGGFDVSSRHVAGLAVWFVVVGLLVFGATARTTVGRPLYWACGLIGGLAILSALSSLWSGSVELSVIEADRVLVYLGFFLAAFLIAQTTERRQRFGEGLAIAITLVCLLGLGSRLLPHVFELEDALGVGPRLRYPLGYWNANGAVCGIAIAMLLWSSRRAGWIALRWISVALMPAVLLCLYFTYSRGGVLSLLVAAGILMILSRERLWLLATAAIALLATLPAVLAVQSRGALADNLPAPEITDQGLTVLAILLGGIAVSLLLFAGLRRLESRAGRLTGRAVTMSQNPTLLKRLAIVASVVAIGLAIAVGGRAWDQFSSSDIQFPKDPQAHFGELSGAGRHDFWRVALKGLGEEPLLGHGAGTYEFTWEQHRSIDMPVHDAHSLYLEAFDELGVVGGLLVLVLVGALLWFGFAAWRAAAGNERELCAVLFAAMVAFAIGAAFDWFWEIAAMGAIFFLAAGVVVSVRCAQLAKERPASRVDGRRFGLALGGLAAAWITAVALVGPLLVDREIKASQSAAAEGDISSAISHAETARSIEPWAASPYVQLGLLAELQGNFPNAAARLTQAIEREDRNWQLYYLRARVRGESGDAAAAEADLERARQLNPRAPELQVTE
ncbi:MAG: O-antigen ligase family protein [Thermoleophilia bacterium]|nr:O-antigen ligase family protein [Thermoleophilia bacterium]